jgi:D-serine deaminase-like pyridoxal phosphate-dependent protein
MRLNDLRTPAVLIEFSRARDNIERMQALARQAGVRLRPHAKAHKSPQIAGWQLDAGAVGLCCAKLGEAEAFADAGVRDLRIAYPLHPSNADRVFALMDRGVALSFVVNDAEVARAWSAAAHASGRRLDVLVKVDVGFHRCGIDPSDPDAVDFIAEVAVAPGLCFKGLLSHTGHAYLQPSNEALATVARDEARMLHELAEAVRRRGVTVTELSVGSTPTARFIAQTAGLSEMRPGNYVYYDRGQVALGSAQLNQCALTVLSTVVSKHGDRVILDAGSKTLSSDLIARTGFPGYGAVFADLASVDTINEDLHIERLSEEHATVHVTGTTTLRPGDRVRILPNHACVVSNLADEGALIAGTHVVDTMLVVARGKSR